MKKFPLLIALHISRGHTFKLFFDFGPVKTYTISQNVLKNHFYIEFAMNDHALT